MAENYNGVYDTPDIGTSIENLDLYYADMPGRYIDDILKSDLPGSHLDNLLYGELPGSHLDVVLESPLPGGSTDELLNSPLPGGISYGIDSIGRGWSYGRSSGSHNHHATQGSGSVAQAVSYGSRSAYADSDRRTPDELRGRFREKLEDRRREIQEEQKRQDYIADLEQASYAKAMEAQNRINNEFRKGLDDLDTLWKSVQKNVSANREQNRMRREKRRSAPVSTPFSRARNSSGFARSEIKKERPKRQVGIAGAFFIMILLLTLLNRVIIPLVNHLSSGFGSEQVETVTDTGGFYLTDDEFDVFVDVYNDVMKDEGKVAEYFELSDEEFMDTFRGYGYETDSDTEQNYVYGNYVGGTTWVSVLRDDDYIDYQCQTVSDTVDLATVEAALSSTYPIFAREYLGRDISEFGMSMDVVEKFYNEAGDATNVSYETDNFSIYFYKYEENVGFYLYGDGAPVYLQIDTDGGWLSMVSVWH